ncbi:uncharacterized protein LOC112576324 [Pomacea canaliculata]|uniref:uncharacterized protein LOC112576324 n=1 Tax=Pomacea canaliculata TaxID=400727 RepID=UPI000D73295C|nr:uncharacterized protein LOC112576324 [Pomacea canaliculata]XP_025114470.1 uncharacterized protein LOC112576324 [Pomacea canaliculata]
MAGVEQMFVLTQFKYTDYLNSIPEQFKGHLLPVPSLVHEHQQNRSFDLLIIHRRYGVMVGVVRDCSNNGDEGQPDNDTDTIRLSQVSEATEQLNTAKRFVSEVMSDKENFPKVRQVLLLFGIAHPTVESLPDNNQSPNDLRTLYLESIPDCLEPNSCLVKEKFKEEWDKLATESRHIFALNEKQYLGLIGRFCGPATSTVLSMESKSYQLPKTLRDAVSLTGDMFERSFLYPNMTKLLNERFLFLAGPPGTGKTRMLALVGRKWVLEGHPVHIISTSPGGEKVAKHLKQLISSSESPEPKNVFHLTLNLDDTTNVTSKLDLIQQNSHENSQEAYVIAVELNFQMRQAAKRTLALAVKLASYGYGLVKSRIDYATSQQEPSKTNNEIGIDDIPPTEENIQRRKSVASLFTELCRRFPNLYMWGAGCTELDIQSKVPVLRMELLTECLTCPPSVVREASEKIRISGVGKYTANQSHVPTSGPPVKHLNHQEHLVKNPPQECITCATDIINFLINDLLIKDKNIKEEVDTQEILTSHLLQSDPIQYSDILIFFESEVNVDTPMVQYLLAEGIPVTVINHPNQSTEVTQDKNSVLVAKSSLYLGYRRKVVVFVEGDTDSNDITVRWNRLRCWTCCTSQLILVHNVKT